MSHLDFRREIAICLLKMSMVSHLQVGGGPRVNLPDDVRFDGEDHEKVVSQGVFLDVVVLFCFISRYPMYAIDESAIFDWL